MIKAVIIDDEERASRVLNSLIEEYCPDVTVLAVCSSVPEAVLAIHKHKPDVVFSDIEMPGLDGYELSFEIQSDGGLSNAYIILHTSLSSEICVERAKQVGAHEALEKFNAGDLIKAMLRGAAKLETGCVTEHIDVDV